jgi:hypothetical protein
VQVLMTWAVHLIKAISLTRYNANPSKRGNRYQRNKTRHLSVFLLNVSVSVWMR